MEEQESENSIIAVLPVQLLWLFVSCTSRTLSVGRIWCVPGTEV